MKGSGSVRVLVVDDEALSRAVTLDLLRRDGRIDVVGTATDGREAVDSARALRPDVVVMDLYMPLLDGIEATRTIVEEEPDACVVLYTSSDQPGDFERARAVGAVAYLPKQEGFDRLVATVLDAVERCRAVA